MKVKKQISYPNLLKKAQATFNAWIRLRDAERGCITCGKYKIEHACHFYSAGHYTGLRFNEDNVHGGCIRCNYFLHSAGNEYRRNIEQRIGKDRLLLLDATATRERFKKWSRLELLLIISIYQNKLKQAA